MAAGNADVHPDRTAMVWIEDTTGSITRGLADAMTAKDVHVRLTGAPAFRPGDVVSFRICARREAPIVAARARVAKVEPEADAFSCLLEWTPPTAGRGLLETWLAAAA